MEEKKNHKIIDVLEGMEIHEKKEKQIIDLGEEIGINKTENESLHIPENQKEMDSFKQTTNSLTETFQVNQEEYPQISQSNQSDPFESREMNSDVQDKEEKDLSDISKTQDRDLSSKKEENDLILGPDLANEAVNLDDFDAFQQSIQKENPTISHNINEILNKDRLLKHEEGSVPFHKKTLSSKSDLKKKQRKRTNEREGGGHKKKKFDIRLLLISLLLLLLIVVLYFGFQIYQQFHNADATTDSVSEETVISGNNDTEGPVFIGFLNRVVVNLNAVDVDFSKYYLAEDQDQQTPVHVKGTVDLSVEGEYPITVSSTDQSGNTTSKEAVVQVVSEDNMASVPVELSSMIDGSIPFAPDTKQRVDANVILFYYTEVSPEIKSEIERLGIDLSSYHQDSYWHPDDLENFYTN